MNYEQLYHKWKILLENSLQEQELPPEKDPYDVEPAQTSGKGSRMSAVQMIAKAKLTWNKQTLMKSWNSSVRGMPSVLQTVRATCKDKDILAILSEIGNKDFITVSHYTNVADADEFEQDKYATMAAELEGENIGRRQMNLIWPNILEGVQMHADRAVGMLAALEKEFANIPGDFGQIFRVKGIINDDKVENFVNFYGFLCLLSLSSTIVHEFAHAYDPNNSWNYVGAGAQEIWDSLATDEKEAMSSMVRRAFNKFKVKSKRLRKRPDLISQAIQMQGEFFAINRQKKYVNDIFNGEVIKALLDPQAGVGPQKSRTVNGLDLAPFSLASWRVFITDNDVGDSDKMSELNNELYQTYKKDVASNIMNEYKKAMLYDPEDYGKKCSNAIVKKVGGDSLAAIALGLPDEYKRVDEMKHTEQLNDSIIKKKDHKKMNNNSTRTISEKLLKKIITEEANKLTNEQYGAGAYYRPLSKRVIADKDFEKDSREWCGHCTKEENWSKQECIDLFAREPGGMEGVLARCANVPTSSTYKSKKVRRRCNGLGGSGYRFLRSQVRKIGVKRLSRRIAVKMLQNLLNYVIPGLPGGGAQNRLTVDGRTGPATRGAVQFFQEKSPGFKINQCAGSLEIKRLLGMYFKKHGGSGISYLYRDSARAAGTSIDEEGNVLPTFQSLPSKLHKQMEHIQKYLPKIKSNFIIVDDKNRRLYIFSPKEEYPGSGPKLIAAMPVITGLTKGDKYTVSYKQFFEKYGLLKTYARVAKDPELRINFENEAFNAYLKYMNKMKSRVTPSGIYNITSAYETVTAKDKKGYGDAVLSIDDPMAPEGGVAIHGTGVPARKRALRKAAKIFDLNPMSSKVQATIKKVGSYGCINVGDKSLRLIRKLISLNSSPVFVLPEDSNKILNFADFEDFTKASNGAEDKYFKKLEKRGIFNSSAAGLLAAADSSAVEQVDPSDAGAVAKAKRKAKIGIAKDFTASEPK